MPAGSGGEGSGFLATTPEVGDWNVRAWRKRVNMSAILCQLRSNMSASTQVLCQIIKHTGGGIKLCPFSVLPHASLPSIVCFLRAVTTPLQLLLPTKV